MLSSCTPYIQQVALMLYDLTQHLSPSGRRQTQFQSLQQDVNAPGEAPQNLISTKKGRVDDITLLNDCALAGERSAKKYYSFNSAGATRPSQRGGLGRLNETISANSRTNGNVSRDDDVAAVTSVVEFLVLTCQSVILTSLLSTPQSNYVRSSDVASECDLEFWNISTDWNRRILLIDDLSALFKTDMEVAL